MYLSAIFLHRIVLIVMMSAVDISKINIYFKNWGEIILRETFEKRWFCVEYVGKLLL